MLYKVTQAVFFKSYSSSSFVNVYSCCSCFISLDKKDNFGYFADYDNLKIGIFPGYKPREGLPG